MKVTLKRIGIALVIVGSFALGGIALDNAPQRASAQTAPTATPGMGGMDMGGMQMSPTATSGMGGMDMGGMQMPSEATPAASGSMAEMDMSGQGMQGMDMMGSQWMSAEDMARMDSHMQPIASDNLVPAPHEQGLQPLDYYMEDGVKIFELVARPYLWEILPNVTTVAWTYNGMIPGPMIRVTEGDSVRIVFRNELPEPTTVHWHGVQVPSNMDGVPHLSQDPVQPGGTFTYEFTANPVGTHWYHSHYHEDFQIGLGLHGAFIIDPATPEENPPDVDVTLMLNEHRILGGRTFASMPMGGMDPNYFTINGRAYPSSQPIIVQHGQRVRIRFIAAGQFIHPMHLHGMPFEVVAIDGQPVPESAVQTMDTVTVAPGQRYDIEFIATERGPWMLHCHISHHTTNNFGIEHGGLVIAVVVM